MASQDLSATRRSLHAVAECVLAGPQYRRSGTIRLRVTPGGFGTVAQPDLRVDGAVLLGAGIRVPLPGTTLREVAARAGVDLGRPGDLYHGGSAADPGDPVVVDERAAGELAAYLALGEAALARLAPDQTPVLWPEHFDLAVTVDEVNYGVSPGDDWLDEPYAYVGPWRRRVGPFWNAPFGASRLMRQLDDVDSLTAFLIEGRDRTGSDPTAD
jgi:hypothetical protein